MASLKITRAVAARARIGRVDSRPLETPEAVLGDWYVTLTQVDGRNAFVYMSERSLLSFLMLEGERVTPAKLFSSFIGGLLLTLETAGHSEQTRDRVLAEYAVGAIDRATDLSLLGSLTNVALDYAAFIEHDGGLSRCNISDVVMSINTRPAKRLGFDSPLEVTALLLRGVAT